MTLHLRRGLVRLERLFSLEPPGGVREGHGRVDQGQVAVALGEVAQQALRPNVNVLAEQPQVVAVAQDLLSCSVVAIENFSVVIAGYAAWKSSRNCTASA